MRNILHTASLTAMLIASFPASASNSWTVGQQSISYSDSHPLLAPNTAPAYAYQPADIASNFTESLWEHTGGAVGGQYDGPGVGAESKARFDCNVAFESHDDPLLAHGVSGGSTHDHSFFGNVDAGSAPFNVTYSSLRSSGTSTCYGGPLNRTLYWEPSIKKVLTNGAVVSIKMYNIATYYELGLLTTGGGGTSDPANGSIWPRSLEFIAGFDMNDPTNTRMSNIVAAANAASTVGRYSLSTQKHGFVGWQCVSPAGGSGVGGATAAAPDQTSGYEPYLKDVSGNPTLSCNANTEIEAEFASYPCWDGVNFDSPDERGHMIDFIHDNNTGKDVCPDNWARTVVFRAKVTFLQTGQSDYTNWWFSSDRMPGMTQFLNGQSGHFDLIPAWSYGTAANPGAFILFAVHCNGMTVTQAATGGSTATLTGDPHECGTGRISSTVQIWHNNEASPDGSTPSPNVLTNPDQSGSKHYFPAPAHTPIPGSVHHAH